MMSCAASTSSSLRCSTRAENRLDPRREPRAARTASRRSRRRRARGRRRDRALRRARVNITIGTFDCARASGGTPRSRRLPGKPDVEHHESHGMASQLGDRFPSPDFNQRTRQPSCCSRYDLTRRPIDSSSSTSSSTLPVCPPSTSLRGRCLRPERSRRARSQDGTRFTRIPIRRTVPDALRPARPLTVAVGGELNRNHVAVLLLQDDRSWRDRSDHAAVDTVVLRAGRRLNEHLGADHTAAEETGRSSPSTARSRPAPPRRRCWSATSTMARTMKRLRFILV